MTEAKKLPCGHLFHVHCLRSWLERQHTCPTCRAPLLGSEDEFELDDHDDEDMDIDNPHPEGISFKALGEPPLDRTIVFHQT